MNKNLLKVILNILSLCLIFSLYTPLNVFAENLHTYAWIEGESGTKDSGSAFGTISGDVGTTYESLSSRKAFRVKSGTETGIGINYNFYVDKAQAYDIFVHGTYENDSDYMSTIAMFVDDKKTDFTNLGSEGWIIKGSSSYNFQIGWQKITTQLGAGSHKFRWQLDGIGKKASNNKAVIDVIIVLPSDRNFSPTQLETPDSIFPAKNVIDYELCTLLTEYDLSTVETNLELPSTTVGGYNVIWSSSDNKVIDKNGNITLTDDEQKAIITATISKDGVNYSKDFEVVVRQEKFSAVATFKNGQIDLTYKCPKSVGDVPYSLFIAAYTGDNESALEKVKIVNGVFEKATSGEIESIEPICSDDITRNVLFLWKRNTLQPLMPKFELKLSGKFVMSPSNEVVELHTERLVKYLEDSYDSIAGYVVSGEQNDRPLPVKLNWTCIDQNFESKEYIVKISEKIDMSDPIIITTTDSFYDLYNLKASQKYYWTVVAKNGTEELSSNITTFYTTGTPRNLFVPNVRNARDVGGWKTSDGKEVKQGILFRTARLDSIKEEGIKILRDDLKIKTEIDLRRDSDDPVYGDHSPIGDNVQYFRFPMEYGDYLTTNVESIKSVFGVLSDENNYPIIYHCSAGADRTGVITYLINGLLGVAQEDLFRDYLLTNFGGTARDMSYINGQYVKILEEYDNGQGTLQERIYKYLNEEIGIPADELDAVIRIFKVKISGKESRKYNDYQ